MSKKLALICIVFGLLLIPSALAQTASNTMWGASTASNIVKGFLSAFFGPDIPTEFTKDAYSIFQWLILPFLALWVVIFGILSEIRIFRAKPHLNWILALIISALAGPTGALVYSVRVVFVLYGTMAFWLFAGLLFVGTILWAGSFYYRWGDTGEGWKGAMQKMYRISNLETRIEGKLRQLRYASGEERKKLLDEIKELEKLIDEKKTENI